MRARGETKEIPVLWTAKLSPANFSEPAPNTRAGGRRGQGEGRSKRRRTKKRKEGNSEDPLLEVLGAHSQRRRAEKED